MAFDWCRYDDEHDLQRHLENRGFGGTFWHLLIYIASCGYFLHINLEDIFYNLLFGFMGFND